MYLMQKRAVYVEFVVDSRLMSSLIELEILLYQYNPLVI